MFGILRKSLATGIVTTGYPEAPAATSKYARGRPEIDFAQWKDARPAAAICPTGAIRSADNNNVRTATLDLGACIFCGLCAEVDPAIRMTNMCEIAVRRREDLRTSATYELNPEGTHRKMIALEPGAAERRTPALREVSAKDAPRRAGALRSESVDILGSQLQESIQKVLG